MNPSSVSGSISPSTPPAKELFPLAVMALVVYTAISTSPPMRPPKPPARADAASVVTVAPDQLAPILPAVE